MSAAFALRAPWYVRERGQFDLRDPRALRPSIQKYGDAKFVRRMLADPRDSLQFLAEDRWSYPVPITLDKARGRERFATHRLHTTKMRKLFQPTHDRYYTVAVEVFCDQPGLPRAGEHTDLEAGFVMRRLQTTLEGDQKQMRKLARELIVADAEARGWPAPATTEADSPDLYLADRAWRRQFAEDHGDLLAAVSATHAVQAWMTNADGGLWRDVGAEPPKGELPRTEEEFPMWRLPDSAARCAKGRSRSLWFGVVPTFSAEHWIGPGPDRPVLAKLDDHEIYELVCFVRQPPEPGREDCPPRIWFSRPSRPFRLAAPFDPDGTKNHSVTIAAPDLRRLAARAGQKLGPGGVRIVTPPGSALPPVKFDQIGKSANGAPGAGDSICLFAFELFFLVAMFLFLLFLPIIAFMFQLWWMLALKFCLPGDAIAILKAFLQDGTKDLASMSADAAKQLETVTQMPDAVALLSGAPTFPRPAGAPTALRDLVEAMDPAEAAAKPKPDRPASKPGDPLCPVSGPAP